MICMGYQRCTCLSSPADELLSTAGVIYIQVWQSFQVFSLSTELHNSANAY